MQALSKMRWIWCRAMHCVYEFSDHKTENAEDKDAAVTVMMSKAANSVACETALAIVDGVHFTRDLTNEPSNILTTQNSPTDWSR